MNSKSYYKNLDTKFIKYWEKKRENKYFYTFFHTTYFALPISVILGITNFGISGLLTFNNIILTFLTFFFYSLYVYFFEFNINERRYQKIIKESKKIDNQ